MNLINPSSENSQEFLKISQKNLSREEKLYLAFWNIFGIWDTWNFNDNFDWLKFLSSKNYVTKAILPKLISGVHKLTKIEMEFLAFSEIYFGFKSHIMVFSTCENVDVNFHWNRRARRHGRLWVICPSRRLRVNWIS